MKTFITTMTATIVGLGLFALAAAYVANPATAKTKAKTEQGSLADYEDRLRVYDASELTGKILREREGTILIERVLGTCLDEDGNGRMLNPDNPDYDRISYADVENVHAGDVVETYLVYDPTTTGYEDVVVRFDFVVDKVVESENFEPLKESASDDESGRLIQFRKVG